MHSICFRKLSVKTSFQLLWKSQTIYKKRNKTTLPATQNVSLWVLMMKTSSYFCFFTPSPPLPQYQSDLQQKVTVHSCSWQELDLFRGTELHSCFTMCLGLVGSGLEWRWDCLDLIDWMSQLWSKVNSKARKGSSTSQPWNALTW